MSLKALAVTMAISSSAQAQITENKKLADDARLSWWREARFGMFIHWGVYAIPGRGEWVMSNEKIPVAKYAEYIGQFNPVKFNAEEWVSIAKGAGMKYIIITAKHHDGFALFKSKASKWNMVDATPFGRDVILELANACARQDIRLGFYYSQALDWLNGGAPGAPGARKWDPLQERPFDEYIEQVALPQLKELLTNYGHGVPAILWWDQGYGITPEIGAKFNDLIHKHDPSVIMNGRLGGGVGGDMDNVEGMIPAARPGKKDFETCMTMNGAWGFNAKNNTWKSSEELIQELCDLAAKGGNYLLNIGPMGDGSIPEPSVTRLKEIGSWMRINSEAIYGTQQSPFPYRMPWGSVSRKGDMLYLFVYTWPETGLLNVPLRNQASRAWVLGSPNDLLKIESDSGSFNIKIPAAKPLSPVTVIAVNIKGEPILGNLPPAPRGPVVPQTEDGSITLNGVDCDMEGSHIGKRDGLIVGWANADSYVRWRMNVRKPGRYRVAMNYGVDAPWAGSILSLTCGSETLEFRVEATKGFRDLQTRPIGEINIPEAGLNELTFKIIKISKGGSVGDLKFIELLPIQ